MIRINGTLLNHPPGKPSSINSFHMNRRYDTMDLEYVASRSTLILRKMGRHISRLCVRDGSRGVKNRFFDFPLLLAPMGHTSDWLSVL